MAKIYTKTGDSGQTALFSGKRVSKDHLRIEAYGELDELNASLGVARAALRTPGEVSWVSVAPRPGMAAPILDTRIARIQSELFVLGAELANPQKKRSRLATSSLLAARHVLLLESEIDEMESALPPLKTFILPAGSWAAAQLHLARTVCRRAERRILPLHRREKLRPEVLQYVNRLSDYLFVAARFAEAISGRSDTPWTPPPAAKSEV